MSSDDLEAVNLWYVVGIGGVYYGTKMQAEAEAELEVWKKNKEEIFSKE